VGFSHRVYCRGFNEAIGTLCFPFFILYGVSLWRSVLLACLLPWSAARGEVLQYLTRSALSHVESCHIRVFRLFTFPAFLSKTRQYTQDFIVPSNFHHNLDNILGDQTDSVGTLSGGLATKTDSVSIPASCGIATETDIMGRPAPGCSLYTEYTVYRYTYLDRL